MLALLWLPGWFWHPDRTGVCSATDRSGCGYQAWSGWMSDIGEVTIIGGMVSVVLMMYRHFNCHADRCWRLAWHTHDDHGHPVCRHHHPHGDAAPHTIGGTPHDRLDLA